MSTFINAIMIAAAIGIVVMIAFAPEFGDVDERKIQCMRGIDHSSLKPKTEKEREDMIRLCRVYYQINPQAK